MGREGGRERERDPQSNWFSIRRSLQRARDHCTICSFSLAWPMSSFWPALTKSLFPLHQPKWRQRERQKDTHRETQRERGVQYPFAWDSFIALAIMITPISLLCPFSFLFCLHIAFSTIHNFHDETPCMPTNTVMTHERERERHVCRRKREGKKRKGTQIWPVCAQYDESPFCYFFRNLCWWNDTRRIIEPNTSLSHLWEKTFFSTHDS